MPRTTPRGRRRSESSHGASALVLSFGLFLFAWDRHASAEIYLPELTRLDLGGGQTLRILTVEGRQRGERLGSAVVPWQPKAGASWAILISAPSFDSEMSGLGRSIWLHSFSTGKGRLDDATFGNLPARGKLGLAMTGSGDFDGDGSRELVLGAPYCEGVAHRAGAVSVLRWQGPEAPPQVRFLMGEAARAHFGTALDAVGDVNDDGFDDLVVGAPVLTGLWKEEGAAYLHLGSARGLDTNCAWTAWGGRPGMRFGEVVRAAGDVDGDGFADVLVAAPRWGEALPGHGEVRLYRGCREGLSSEPAWVYRGPRPYAKAGRGLWGGLDLNRDGLADAMVGLPSANVPGGAGFPGEVHFFFGRPGGFASEPDWIWQGTDPGGGFGEALCWVGDMNGDGFGELAVAAPFTPIVGKQQGVLRIFPGIPSGFSTTPMIQVQGGILHARYGFVVSALGDVDGDGLADLAVGSPEFATRDHANGRCDVLFGSRGLGMRAIVLEALRRPCFRTPITATLLAEVMEVRRTPNPFSAPDRLAWRSSPWMLLGGALGLIGVLVVAWRSARGRLEAIRHRLHDFVGCELARIDPQDSGVRRVVDELRALVWAVKQERPTVPGLVGQLADWAWEFASERGLSLRLIRGMRS